jgi:hypothetical protein
VGDRHEVMMMMVVVIIVGCLVDDDDKCSIQYNAASWSS